ncbi:hypothetical protein ACFY9C_10715 [Streptomyces filamentosus]
MNENAPGTQQADGLLVARTSIAAARSRAQHESDGGGTGRSDGND